MSIANAIRERKLLQFTYDGFSRTVEPHAYGIDRKNRYVVRAFQVAGGSESGEYVGWKLFCEDEMLGTAVLNQTFSGPRPGYKRGDKAMYQIVEEL